MRDITYIGPETRCAECGKLADRVSPDDPDIPGCGKCFPHWAAHYVTLDPADYEQFTMEVTFLGSPVLLWDEPEDTDG